jgi:hypothetical protein
MTGKSMHTIKDVIEPAGDMMRVSNGIYVVEHPSSSLRVGKPPAAGLQIISRALRGPGYISELNTVVKW